MIRAVLVAIALSVLAPASAQLPSPLPEVAADVAKVDRHPTHDVAFSNGVRGIPSVVYWEPVGCRPLSLDLYLPASSVAWPATGFPLVMYIHGDGWLGGGAHRNGPFVDFPGVLASLSRTGSGRDRFGNRHLGRLNRTEHIRLHR